MGVPARTARDSMAHSVRRGRLACADRNLVAPGVDAARVTPFSTLGVASDPLAHINPFLNRSKVNRTGKNACGFNPKSLGKTWNTYYAALNERDFNKAGRPCGKCATVKGSRGNG